MFSATFRKFRILVQDTGAGQLYRGGSMKIVVMFSILVAATTVPKESANYSPPFTEAMSASMTAMDREMATAPMTGNIDHDFATMMMPHHRGAINMAKEELGHGSDPVMRRLAQEILVDQQSEIEVMALWLRKTGMGTKEQQ
jgi:DUF305 family protein family protein